MHRVTSAVDGGKSKRNVLSVYRKKHPENPERESEHNFPERAREKMRVGIYPENIDPENCMYMLAAPASLIFTVISSRLLAEKKFSRDFQT